MNILLLLYILLFVGTPIDKNDNYIEQEISNLNELIQNGHFEKGFILTNGDTFRTEILRFSKRKKLNSYLFCITKNKKDSISVYTAKQISGYSIGTESFKQHISEGSHYFIRLCKTGKAILFERDGIPSDNRFVYFIKLPQYSSYFVICPNEQNITIAPVGGFTSGNPSTLPTDLYNSKNINERFKFFASTFLNDCPILSNMIQSEFYTINDIPSIIDKYNQCDNK